MAGYLVYVTVAQVFEEMPSENQMKSLRREVQNNLDVLVIDQDETPTVREDMEEIEVPLPHHHQSSRRRNCDYCVGHAQDEQSVQVPE